MGGQWSQSGYFANLTNGVSQQPPRVRLESQQDEAINMWPTTYHQMGHRCPLEIVSKLTGLESWLNIPTYGYPYEHEYTRDSSESYDIFFDGNGHVRVHDRATGAVKTVTMTAVDSYLTATTPESNFHALTYKDVTFVVNKSVTVALQSTLSATRTPEALVHIKDFVAGASYSVTVNINSTTITVAPTGADVSAVATDLVTKLSAAGGWPAGTGIVSYGNVVWFHHATLTGVSVKDNRAATAIASYKSTILSTSKLPPYAFDGYIMQVTGSSSTSAAQDKNTNDDQYYQFVSDITGAMGSGTWVETRAPGIKYLIDPVTAPHTLTRNADGTFTWDVITWGSRDVGDTATNPNPLFIDQTIACTFLLGGRLGFISGNEFILSQTGEDSFFNFFRQTTAATLDDDPVYGTVPSTQVNKSYWPVGWNGELVIFGDLVDGDVTYNNKLSLTNLNITTPTVTNVSPNCAPILSGSDLLFISELGNFSNIGSYTLDPVTTLRRADSITEDYLGAYIPKNVKRMTGRAKDFVAVFSTDTRSKIYIMTYSKKNNQLVQQAVVTWDFSSVVGMTILDVNVDKNWLYVTYIGPDSYVYVGRIDVSIGASDPGYSFKCCLDHRQTVTGTYNAGTNLTTFTLAKHIDASSVSDLRAVVATIGVAETNFCVGENLTIASSTATTISIVGDVSAVGISLYVGYAYERYFIPNPIYAKSQTATGTKLVNVLHEINLSDIAIGYFKTQYIKAELISKVSGRVLSSREFIAGLQLDGNRVRLDDNTTTFDGVLLLEGQNALASDTYLKISSNSHLPFFCDMIQWLATDYTAEL